MAEVETQMAPEAAAPTAVEVPAEKKSGSKMWLWVGIAVAVVVVVGLLFWLL
ncbi:hypothetical protein HN935_01165 [archaeon]|nr:hypothetical protein [archaeon]